MAHLKKIMRGAVPGLAVHFERKTDHHTNKEIDVSQTYLNQDIMTPILAIFGGTDFSNLYVKLGSGDTAPVLMYGNFITAVINFLITAFVIFCLVKFINKLGDTLHHKEEAPAAPTTKKCPFCKSEIAIDATRCPHCTSQLDK